MKRQVIIMFLAILMTCGLVGCNEKETVVEKEAVEQEVVADVSDEVINSESQDNLVVESEATEVIETMQEVETTEDTEDIQTAKNPVQNTVEGTKNAIASYGVNESGESLYSFLLVGDTMQQNTDGNYEIDVELLAPVTVKAGMKPGDSVTVVMDYLEYREETLTMKEDGSLYDSYDMEYYYNEEPGKDMVVLGCDSGDRVEAPCMNGKIVVSKDAVVRVDILNEETPVSNYTFSESDYFNGVVFDQNGVVTKLVFYGD